MERETPAGDSKVHAVAVRIRIARRTRRPHVGRTEAAEVTELAGDGIGLPGKLGLVVGELPLAPATVCEMLTRWCDAGG